MIERFRVINDVGIEDDLTGETYTNFRQICAVLNKVNRRLIKMQSCILTF